MVELKIILTLMDYIILLNVFWKILNILDHFLIHL